MDFREVVPEAERRIRPHVRETPLVRSPPFNDATRARVAFKLENLQHTGSFKLRGAVHKLLTLSADQRARGVVAASTGNHGAAIAYAASRLHTPCRVFVPEQASPSKLDAIRRSGAVVEVYGIDSGATETHARAVAGEQGLAYVSPYNDPAVVVGQGTIGLELARQADRIDVLYVALGGGGLVSGIAGYLRTLWPGVRVVACSPEASPVMVASVRAGRILEMASQPTLSDGTAGGIEPDAITFDLCRRLVDEYVLVSETEIAEAMRRYMDAHDDVIEGAAGVAVAGLLKTADACRGRHVVVVICGGNIGRDVLQRVRG